MYNEIVEAHKSGRDLSRDQENFLENNIGFRKLINIIFDKNKAFGEEDRFKSLFEYLGQEISCQIDEFNNIIGDFDGVPQAEYIDRVPLF